MQKIKTYIYNIVLFVLILLCFIFLFKIRYTVYQYYQSDSTYKEIAEENISKITETNEDDSEIEKPEFPNISIDIENLLSKNKDFIGWLYFADGNINLPVVKETVEDINKYEDYDFYGRQNAGGCLFISYDVKNDFSLNNNYIYGHNMKNGSMFGTLKNLYRNPELINDPYFYIWTKDGESIKYRVLAIYKTTESSEMYTIPKDKKAQSKYLDKMFRKGSIITQIPLTVREQSAVSNSNDLTTLYTCYGKTGSDERLFVQGIEIVREKFVN